jgi:hypothetical protein
VSTSANRWPRSSGREPLPSALRSWSPLTHRRTP